MKSSQQSGFTLIELMISLVIGLIIVAAALVLFLQGKRVLLYNKAHQIYRIILILLSIILPKTFALPI
jgi:prepilin-type N-terminal cleavage/methylation domain-containing protein